MRSRRRVISLFVTCNLGWLENQQEPPAPYRYVPWHVVSYYLPPFAPESTLLRPTLSATPDLLPNVVDLPKKLFSTFVDPRELKRRVRHLSGYRRRYYTSFKDVNPLRCAKLSQKRVLGHASRSHFRPSPLCNQGPSEPVPLYHQLSQTGIGFRQRAAIPLGVS